MRAEGEGYSSFPSQPFPEAPSPSCVTVSATTWDGGSRLIRPLTATGASRTLKPVRSADRLFRIVHLLRQGRLLTAARLAEKLQVSTHTIYRDVVDLQFSGMPIEGEAGVGYTIRRDFDLPPLLFTSVELTGLVLGARLVQAWGGVESVAAA